MPQGTPHYTGNPAVAVETTENRKTGRVSATYVSQSSCPGNCPLFHAGCYAEHGLPFMTTRRVNASPVSDPAEIARQEAAEIDKLTGLNLLRLHVVGDATTDQAASIIAEAAERYTARHGRPVWTYTHAWRDVDRDSFGPINVSASCESADDISAAKARGYSTVVIYDIGDRDKWHSATADRPFVMQDSHGQEHKIVPCPEQFGRAINCASCKGLCTDTANMRKHDLTVGFVTHGVRRGTVGRMLQSKEG